MSTVLPRGFVGKQSCLMYWLWSWKVEQLLLLGTEAWRLYKGKGGTVVTQYVTVKLDKLWAGCIYRRITRRSCSLQETSVASSATKAKSS